MRRSRATYRPTVTPVGSTHVDSFTGTTSSKLLHGPLKATSIRDTIEI